MSSIVIAGDTSGTVTLQAPAVSGSSVLTLPAITDTVLTRNSTDTSVINFGSGQFYKDTSGYVGIGTSSPSQKLHVNGNALLGGSPATQYSTVTVAGDAAIQSAAPLLNFVNAAGSSRFGYLYHTGTGGNLYLLNAEAGPLIFATSNTERVRIDSSGNFLVGTTTTAGRITCSFVSASQQGIVTRSTSETYAGSPMVFQNSSGAASGYIGQTTSAVTYNTSSDYRMKENVVSLSGGLTTIGALKPVTYDWKIDGSSGEGFIAHELAEIIPLAVSGEKDAVNEDGSIKSQGVDYSKIVVHLVAAIQELSAKNSALEARVAALENK